MKNIISYRDYQYFMTGDIVELSLNGTLIESIKSECFILRGYSRHSKEVSNFFSEVMEKSDFLLGVVIGVEYINSSSRLFIMFKGVESLDVTYNSFILSIPYYEYKSRIKLIKPIMSIGNGIAGICSFCKNHENSICNGKNSCEVINGIDLDLIDNEIGIGDVISLKENVDPNNYRVFGVYSETLEHLLFDVIYCCDILNPYKLYGNSYRDRDFSLDDISRFVIKSKKIYLIRENLHPIKNYHSSLVTTKFLLSEYKLYPIVKEKWIDVSKTYRIGFVKDHDPGSIINMCKYCIFNECDNCIFNKKK